MGEKGSSNFEEIFFWENVKNTTNFIKKVYKLT